MADDIPDGWSLVKPSKENIPEGWKPVVGQGEDVARSGMAGLAQGTAGLIGQAGDAQQALKNSGLDEWLTRKTTSAANRVGDYLQEKFGIPKAMFAGRPGGYSLARPEVGEIRLPTTEEVKKTSIPGLPGANLGALDYDPQFYTGHLAKGAGEFIPGALLGTSARSLPGAAADAFRFGVVPGAAQEAAGQAFKGTKYEGTPVETATRLVTSLASGATAGKFLSPNASKAPISSQQTYAGQVRQLEDHGMPISPGERADSRALRYGESEADPELGKARLEAVTRLATSRIGNGQGGNHGTNIIDHTPGPANTINNILTETGTRVGRVWSSNHFVPDADLGTDLVRMHNDYSASNLYGHDTVTRLHGAATELQDALQHARLNGQVMPNGTPYLNGEQAHRLYSRVRRSARGTEDPNTADALNEFANSLGAQMERTVAITNPNAVGHLAQANRDYRNALVVEKAAKASNVAASAGYITPAKIEDAASSTFGSRAHQRGFDDFGWAPAAKAVYKIMPDSGTSPRQQYHEMFSKWAKPLGFALGSAAGHLTGAEGTALEHSSLMGGLFGEAASAAPEWLMRKGAGWYSGTGVGQAHLGNQLLARAPGPVYEKVYHPNDVPAGLFPRLQPAIRGGDTTRRLSLPGLLTADQTAALHRQRARDRENNQ